MYRASPNRAHPESSSLPTEHRTGSFNAGRRGIPRPTIPEVTGARESADPLHGVTAARITNDTQRSRAVVGPGKGFRHNVKPHALSNSSPGEDSSPSAKALNTKHFLTVRGLRTHFHTHASKRHLEPEPRYYYCNNFDDFDDRRCEPGRVSMVALKLRKVGNSLGVVLPKEVLGHLRADEGQDLFLIEGPNNSYRLTSFDPAFAQKMEKAEEIMGRYRNTLRELAK